MPLTASIKQTNPILPKFHQVDPNNPLYGIMIPPKSQKLHTQDFQ